MRGGGALPLPAAPTACCGGRKPSIGCGVGARATRRTLAGTAGGAIGADIRADTPASSGPVRAASKAGGPMAAPAISDQQKSFLLLRPNRVWPGRKPIASGGRLPPPFAAARLECSLEGLLGRSFRLHGSFARRVLGRRGHVVGLPRWPGMKHDQGCKVAHDQTENKRSTA